jgi:hypothetical protein
MPATRLTMRKIREVLRLSWRGPALGRRWQGSDVAAFLQHIIDGAGFPLKAFA